MKTGLTGAVILVGGQGTRLRPLTLTHPKSLMPVLNKPFISYQLELLKAAGVKDVALATGQTFKKWQKAFKACCPKGLKLHFAFEPSPLGTGGAVRFGAEALERLAKKKFHSFFVLNGDVFCDINLKKALSFHQKKKSECTMILKKVQDPSRFGLVRRSAEGRISQFIEKPKNPKGPAFINAGIYLMDFSIVFGIPSGRAISIERETFPGLLKDRRFFFGMESPGYWNDIGTPATYLQAHLDLLKNRNPWIRKGILYKGSPFLIQGRAFIGPKSAIKKGTILSGAVSIGPSVTIEKNCSITDSVLLEGSVIAEGSKLTKAVIGRHCRIGRNCDIGEGAVLADETRLPAFTKT